VDAKEDVNPLIPLALFALADLLGVTIDELPAGFTGVLRSFGSACHTAGWDRAHDEPTLVNASLPKGVVNR